MTDPNAPTEVTDELAGRRQRFAAVPDDQRDLVALATRAGGALLRHALGAPACYQPPVYVAAGPAGHVTLTIGPAPLSASQVGALTAAADCLERTTEPTDAELDAITDSARAHRAIIDAALERARARAAKVAAIVADDDRWWAADRAENEATERLDRAAEELLGVRRG